MKKKLSNFINRLISEYITLGWIGGSTYVTLEILWRNKSHWSMFILGMICFILLGLINEILPWKTPIELQAVIGSCIITICEFITGCIVNLQLHWDVWDYSDIPFNILGQICLPFSLIWIVISTIAIVLDDWTKYLLYGGQRPYYIFKTEKPESQ